MQSQPLPVRGAFEPSYQMAEYAPPKARLDYSTEHS
jgi:hypothetical protein